MLTLVVIPSMENSVQQLRCYNISFAIHILIRTALLRARTSEYILAETKRTVDE